MIEKLKIEGTIEQEIRLKINEIIDWINDNDGHYCGCFCKNCQETDSHSLVKKQESRPDIKDNCKCGTCSRMCFEIVRNQTLDEVWELINNEWNWYKSLVHPNATIDKILKKIAEMREEKK